MTDPTTPVVAVIDDDSVYQFTANRTLKATQLAHQVLQFTNGQEALAFISSHAAEVNKLPDIIFLDINMPITDGWEFLDEYRKIKKAIAKPIRIYMVSSSIDPRDINRAKDNPEVVEYVEKPVSLSKFSELLKAFGID
ncbi:MAG TPA: response regulator [Cyclobacteriaceae bacterium]|nr:response regulator [Cyclobacteriaceae bacterium]